MFSPVIFVFLFLSSFPFSFYLYFISLILSFFLSVELAAVCLEYFILEVVQFIHFFISCC